MQKKNKDNIRIDHLNAETMTSLEIAEITGKMHKNVLQSIRKMEPSWEKVHQLKFQLSFITRELPNGGAKQEPMYNLNKYECLYVATKFNDEARARLVLRWMELELQARSQQSQRVKRKAPRLPESAKTYTITEIASEYDMTAADMNAMLSHLGLQVKCNKDWVLNPQYEGQGLAIPTPFYSTKDRVRTLEAMFLKWTHKGKMFINNTLEDLRAEQDSSSRKIITLSNQPIYKSV